MTAKNDPENYRKMSEPFKTPKEAEKALIKFFGLVENARNECHIADVHVIIRMNLMRGKKEATGITSGHYGYSANAASMCAWSLGQEQAHNEAAIEELMKG